MTIPVMLVAAMGNWSVAMDAPSPFTLCALTPQWTRVIFLMNGSAMNVRSGTIRQL